jgi:hypothetical protein
MSRPSFLRLWFIAAWASLAGLGCGPPQRVATESEQNLAQLSRLYGVYLSKNKGQAPTNIEALKAFAGKSDQADLKGRGITAADVESIFNSTRDKEPFVYRAPRQSDVPGVGPEEVVFYEKTGVNGKRYVAFTTPGKVAELDPAEFKTAVPEAP